MKHTWETSNTHKHKSHSASVPLDIGWARKNLHGEQLPCSSIQASEHSVNTIPDWIIISNNSNVNGITVSAKPSHWTCWARKSTRRTRAVQWQQCLSIVKTIPESPSRRSLQVLGARRVLVRIPRSSSVILVRQSWNQEYDQDESKTNNAI